MCAPGALAERPPSGVEVLGGRNENWFHPTRQRPAKVMNPTGSATAAPAGSLVDWGRHTTDAESDGADPPSPDSLCDIRVAVVDDCVLHRESLAALMAINGAAEVRMAWDLPTVLAAARGEPLNVMLLNVSTLDSVILLRAVLEIAPYVRVIVVGVSEEDDHGIVASAEAGAAGYHTRNESIEELISLISRLAAGESVCSPRVSAVLLRRLSSLAAKRPLMPDDLTLTTRELEILELVEHGLSNKEIADHLCIAVHTVKNHVHSLLTKLGVSTRGQAAALAHTVR